MRRIILLLFVAISPILSAPMPTTTKKPAAEDAGDLQHNLEYERYLKEVVEALESDPEFRSKLNNATEEDIRTGKIAHELEYVSHHVRSKLDEIKREEMERLRQLIKRQYELTNHIDEEHLKNTSLRHIDHENVDTFEIRDLQKLIRKLTDDLSENDKQRREEFKKYELEKEFEKQQELKRYEEEGTRAEHEAEMKKLEKKHNEHPNMHHPANKAQLEEVWEEQDHMEGADFNPQTFFMMHDLDSNGVWDQNEVRALFIKELDKVYQQGLPEDDMRERAEEMERMREHVFNESDRNRDGVIDYQEFIDQTKRDEFNRDSNWDTVDKEKVYTHEEYLEFERQRQQEINQMMAEHPERYPNYHQDPQHQQNYNQHLDQEHLNQQQQYNNQQQHQPQQNQQHQPQQNQQQYNPQHQNQQQHNQQQQNQQQHNQQQQNQQQHNQQQQNQQQHNQQQNQNQQFQQQNQIPQQQQQQQYQNQQQHNQQQQGNQVPQQQFQQQPAQQQQQQPVQGQPIQQKPISQSANANQIDSNQANGKEHHSAEQKPIQHGQPQVIQQH